MKKIIITILILLFVLINYAQIPLSTNIHPITQGCLSTIVYMSPDTHSVEFKGVIYDFPNAGQSTWFYKVTCSKAPKVKAISHISFPLDLSCINVASYGPLLLVGYYIENNGYYYFNPGSGNPSIVNPDPKTGVIGLKFDDGFDNKLYEYYFFVLDSKPDIDNISAVGIKAGRNIFLENICGPIECGTLPIELLSFSVKDINNKINIKWETASEVNNDYFSIEHSYDNEIFNTIAYIKGASMSNLVLKYSYEYELPNKNGTSYYRLSQTDFDGTSVYLNTICININKRYFSVEIYSIDGKLLYLGNKDDYNFKKNLIYIIKSGNSIEKIIIFD